MHHGELFGNECELMHNLFGWQLHCTRRRDILHELQRGDVFSKRGTLCVLELCSGDLLPRCRPLLHVLRGKHVLVASGLVIVRGLF